MEGIDQAQYTFYKIAPVSELPNGERIFFEIGNKQIVLLNIGGEYFAIGDVCTHDDGPVGEGEIEGCEIICPRHGAHFDVRTGKATMRPAVMPIPVYPVRVVEGFIEVGIGK
jgi:3-phenylpropionate/trans-cinnamate dioxygenase ferredoxin component